MVEGFDPSKGWEYPKELPLSRKQRKRLMSSNSWVVHLYSGEVDNTSYFKESLKGDRVLLEIDISKSKEWNLNQQGSVYQALLWAAFQGKVDSVLAGPPCRTWPILRSEPAEGFPPPGRAADQLYGLTDLDPKERLKVDQDTALVAKQMWLCTFAWFACRPCGVQGFQGCSMTHVGPMGPAT